MVPSQLLLALFLKIDLCSFTYLFNFTLLFFFCYCYVLIYAFEVNNKIDPELILDSLLFFLNKSDETDLHKSLKSVDPVVLLIIEVS